MDCSGCVLATTGSPSARYSISFVGEAPSNAGVGRIGETHTSAVLASSSASRRGRNPVISTDEPNPRSRAYCSMRSRSSGTAPSPIKSSLALTLLFRSSWSMSTKISSFRARTSVPRYATVNGREPFRAARQIAGETPAKSIPVTIGVSSQCISSERAKLGCHSRTLDKQVVAMRNDQMPQRKACDVTASESNEGRSREALSTEGDMCPVIQERHPEHETLAANSCHNQCDQMRSSTCRSPRSSHICFCRRARATEHHARSPANSS